MPQKPQLNLKCQLAPPCPRITLSELKALRVNYSFKHCAAAQRPWAWKPCFGSQGGLEIMIFMKFEILVMLGVRVGHLHPTGKSCISNQIRWDWVPTIALSMLVRGKNLPFKINSGIFHNLGKTTPDPPKTSLIWKVPTSSTLHPNYSIWAKGSTSHIVLIL